MYFYGMKKYLFLLPLIALIVVSATGCSEIEEVAAPVSFDQYMACSAEALAEKNYRKAEEYGASAYRIAESSKSEQDMLDANIMLTVLNIMTFRDSVAWRYAEKAEAIARARNNETALAKILLAKAKIRSYEGTYSNRKPFHESMIYLDEAFDIAIKEKSDLLLAEALMCAGTIFTNSRYKGDDEIHRYNRLLVDNALQELQIKYETKLKDKQLYKSNCTKATLMVLALLLCGFTIMALHSVVKAKRRTMELQRINQTKEQLIASLIKDVKSTSGVQINESSARQLGEFLVERSKIISDLGLTKRELDIMHLGCQGLSAAEIAEKLFISVHTVNNHRQRIYSKLGVSGNKEMKKKASELGII